MSSKKLLIIGTYAPTVESQLSHVLREVLEANMDQVETMYIYDDRGLSAKEKKVQLELMFNYIEKSKPTGIVTFGEAGKLLTDVTGALDKSIGKTSMISERDLFIPTILTFDEEDVEENRKKLQRWALHIYKGYNIALDLVDEMGSTKMVLCDTIEKVKEAVKYVKHTGICSFDFETPKVGKKATFEKGFHATTLSLSFQAGSGYVIPLEHFQSPFSKVAVLGIMEYLKVEIFENTAVRKVAHNINYDAHILRIYGIKLRGRIDDTMLMHHLHDETSFHGLKDLVAEYYPEYAGYEDEVKGMAWDKIPLNILSYYNAIDTDLTLRICILLESYLLEDERSYVIYRNLTMSAFKSLFNAESRGMLVNPRFLEESVKEATIIEDELDVELRRHPVVFRYERYNKKIAKKELIQETEYKLAGLVQAQKDRLIKNIKDRKNKLEGKTEKALVTAEAKIADIEKVLNSDQLLQEKETVTMKEARKKVRDLKAGTITAGEPMNFSSPKQLGDLLYYSPVGFRFATQDGSTGKDILKGLGDETGFIDSLLLNRTVTKTKGTYLQGILDRVDENGYIHTSFKLHGTKSGRLSSANPNLQNMSNAAKLRNEKAIKVVSFVKESFIVPKGYYMAQIDFSQAELRIMGSLANDETMLGAYANDHDLHALTAANMMKITLDGFYMLTPALQKEGRQKAKASNFGLIYGMGANGFREYSRTGYGVILTEDEAIETRKSFFKTYSAIPVYHETYREKARKFGHVRTLYGRRRHTPDINTLSNAKRSAEERVAVNSPVQGTGGEFMLFAIALLENRLPKEVLFVNTIHDSGIFLIPDDILDPSLRMIAKTMENLPNKQYFGNELGNVTMKVDAEISKHSWKALEEYDGFREKI